MTPRLNMLATGAALVLLGSATPALAWGEYGHRTVAAIARANVWPATMARVRDLLRAAPGLDTPQCPIHSLEDAAAWPDCIRADKARWGHTAAWHYRNEPVCGAFARGADCPDNACVTVQIERARRTLAARHADPVARLQALAFLAHLVGDVHQPLHVGDNGDKGGNTVQARYGIAPGRNLHAIWDGPLAERAISSARPRLVRRYSAAERRALVGPRGVGQAQDWARESWVLARDLVYPQAFGALPCGPTKPAAIAWTEADTAASVGPIRRRITQAGLRLARLLDGALEAPSEH